MHLFLHLLLTLSTIVLASPTTTTPRDIERLLFARIDQTEPQSLAIHPRIDKDLDTGQDANLNLSLYTDTSCGAQVPFMDHPVSYNTAYNTSYGTTGKHAKKAEQIRAYKLSRHLNSSEEVDLYSDAGCETQHKRMTKKKGCNRLEVEPVWECIKIVI